MVKRLGKLSLKWKLTLITMIVSTAALLLAASALYAGRSVATRRGVLESAAVDAELVGRTSTTALQSHDTSAATDVLSALHADSSIDAAWLFEPDGQLFAGYHRETAPQPPSAQEVALGAISWRADDVRVFSPIMFQDQLLGTVCVQRSVMGVKSDRAHFLLVLVTIVAGSLLAALLLVWQLQHFVSRPILNLIQTAKAVSDEKNYALRAAPHADDELGMLVHCFNEMLVEIQQRDTILQAHRDRLEDLIALRTEELTQLNGDLTSARDQAERSLAKSAFLANMSHEIRTPMTAILGYSDLLAEQEMSPSERLDAVQVIRRNARHLLDLMNDVLDISKIEAGKMTVERVAIDLPSFIGELISITRPRAVEKGLKLHIDFAGPIPRTVASDPVRLRQILVNLLGNAVKFTLQGEIRLCVRCVLVDGDSRLWFEIHDTGIGMTTEQMARMFQPFTQADGSTTRRFGGTGLGLAISQRLTKLLGGEINVASRAGQGSTFTAVVAGGPLKDIEMLYDASESMLLPAPPEPAPPVIRFKANILLVEDGVDNQKLISTHLCTAGAQVTIAQNGRVALEKVATQDFDLVLMDMQMPEMDGETATRELRRLGLRIPIIALTAHAMAEHRVKCLAAGCTDYLSKPVRKDVLLQTISRHLASAAAQTGAVAQPAPIVEKLRSSLASDPDMQEVLAGFVEKLPLRVDRLAELIHKQDLNQLREVVHQLKGAGGGYGFAEITRRATVIEKAIKSQVAIDNIVAETNRLIELIQRVEGYQNGDSGKNGVRESNES